MKIRTDFVTNSSSSSYCVSYTVALNKRKKICLDLWPDGEDGTSDITIGMKNGVAAFTDAVAECTSVEELTSLIINEMDVEEMLEDVPEAATTEELFRKLDEISDDEDDEYDESFAKEASEKVAAFRESMSKIKGLSEIRSVTVTEFYNGWGEFAEDSVEDFLGNMASNGDDEDSESEDADLSGIFPEEDWELLSDPKFVGTFIADIMTKIDLQDGSVEKSCEIHDIS